MTTPTTPVRSIINGVPLYTRKGLPRRRFLFEEYLAILACEEDDLQDYGQLFMPRRSPHIVRRVRWGQDSGWKTVHHSPTLNQLAMHLVGARIPGRGPVWIGAVGWRLTRWVAIDVDCRGDQADFEERCGFLESRLNDVGIPITSLLVVPTPSGGRHYYLFFEYQCDAEAARRSLTMIGIKHEPGRFELFPTQECGLRLPFGHTPDGQTGPQDWLRFLRDYREGRFPRIDFEVFRRRAEEFARGRYLHKPSSLVVTKTQTRRLTIVPQTHGVQGSSTRPTGADTVAARYLELLTRAQLTGDDAAEFWRLGICKRGTRVAATRRIAWHLVFNRRLSREEAIRACTTWVYSTGRRTSADVESDLTHGTNKVADQTAAIVEWTWKRRNETPGSKVTAKALGVFSASEVEVLADRLTQVPLRRRREFLDFGLEMIRFAKFQGEPNSSGWEGCPSVRGIIRKWPCCSGMRYRAKMAWAIKSGLIEQTREKRQSSDGTGRARTYLVKVPVTPQSEWLLGLDDARTVALRTLEHPSTRGDSTTPERDTYLGSVSRVVNTRGENHKSPSDRTNPSVPTPSTDSPEPELTSITRPIPVTKEAPNDPSPQPNPSLACVTRTFRTDQPGSFGHHYRNGRRQATHPSHVGQRRPGIEPRELPATASGRTHGPTCPTAPSSTRPGPPGRAHPGRTRTHLASRPTSVPRKRSVVQGVRDPTPRHLRTLTDIDDRLTRSYPFLPRPP